MINVYGDIIMFGFANFYFEVMLGSLIFMRKAKKQKYFWLRLACCLILSFLFYFLPPLNIGIFNADYIIIALIVSIELVICFKISYFNGIFYAVAGFTMQHMGWNLMLAFFDAIGLQNFTQVTGVLTYLASYIICYAVAGFVFSDEPAEADKNERGLLLFLSFFIVLLIYAISAILSEKGLWNVYSRIYAIACCVFALCTQFGIFRSGKLKSEKQRLEQENLVLEELLHQSAKQQELSKDTIEIIDRRCHDLKHQISALRNMSEAEREKSISEIEKAIMIYGDIAKTSNEVLNVVLTEKGLICGKYKIRFTYIVDGDSLSFMDPVDLSSLFGNAIDNAIESVMHEEEERRVIKLNVSTMNNFLGVHMENYCGKDLHFEDGLPVTDKADKNNHGFGIKSIRYVAEKYGGCVNVEYRNNLFVLDILFPIHTEEK